MSNPRILHIAQDEKFIKAAHYLFNQAFPGENRFIIIKPSANPPLRFLSKDFSADYLVVSPSIVSDLVEICKNYKVVIFHGVNDLKGALFLQSPHKEKFMGFIYGGEIYNSSISGNEYLGDKSKMLKDKLDRPNLTSVLKEIYRKIRYRKTRHLFEDVNMKDVFYRMNIFGFINEGTHEKFVNKGIMNPSSKTVTFSYYPLDFVVENNDLRASGPNILLGNSASVYNNHLEALDILKQLNLCDRKVISPLSYGSQKYADAVERYGRKCLNGNFLAVRNFMPLEQYNELISSCGFVFMNHYRSEAMGNIITSLYLGAKVFLNETDPYNFFKNMGCHIFLVKKELCSNGTSPFTPLTPEQVEHNRKMLSSKLATSVLVEKLRTSFDKYYGIKHQAFEIAK